MSITKDIKELEAWLPQVRRDIVRMVHAVQSGHPGGSLGCTEFFVALFQYIMDHDPKKFTMDGRDQDIFFLSNGHITPVYYSVLARSGFFPIEELRTFRRINSRLQGHPATQKGLPGIRVATGSLGQGLSVALGAALAKKLNGDLHTVFTLQGDGELQEGQIWEAAMFAAHHKVDNIVVTIDRNNRQIDGDVSDVMDLGDLKAKFEAFGWLVTECENGNHLVEIADALLLAKSLTRNEKPVALIMHTEMGHGVDFMMGSHEWHGIAPNDEQLQRALEQNPETLGDY
ncbi:transketolase [Schleiferia thermophila]|uniref:transketolase n=1 Tax=Schleiferia thermophila TaxID=884107 RepID=UPI002FD9078B